MAETKFNESGNGCGIKMGQVFGEDGISFGDLPEGYGIVITSHNSLEVAYGDAWDMNSPHERDILEKNFAGAKMQHGDHAFLVRKENGIIICQKEKLEKLKPKVVSVSPAWKHERRFNFSQTGEVAARRG